MKKVGDMNTSDRIIIRHMVKTIPDENTTTVVIQETDVLENYGIVLLEMGLLNRPIHVEKLKIIARLIGLFVCKEIKRYNKEYDDNLFCIVKTQKAANEILDDFNLLGFNNDITIIDYGNDYHIVVSSEVFYYFMDLIRTDDLKLYRDKHDITLPKWLMESELSIKREFLSVIYSMNMELDCIYKYYNNNNKLRFESYIEDFIDNDYSDENDTDNTEKECGIDCTGNCVKSNEYNNIIDCTEKIIVLFKEFDIDCSIIIKRQYYSYSEEQDCPGFISINFKNNIDNLVRFVDTFNCIYSDIKRIEYAPIIEHMKIIQKYYYTNYFS